MLRCITDSKAKSTLHGYCIHSHRFIRPSTEKRFCSVQAAIVRALRSQRRIMTMWVFIHPSCDMTPAEGFRRAIQRAGWTISKVDVYYPGLGNTIADSGTFFEHP